MIETEKPSFIKALPKDWLASGSLALLVHVLLFFGSGFAFVKAPEFGVEAASGGIEVSLIAALPASSDAAAVRPQSEPEKDEAGETVPKSEEPKSQKKTIPAEKEENKTPGLVNETPFVGDGSSAVPGQSRTTFYSPGGGSTEEKASYLKNPPPPYPQSAVDRGEEGLVLLSVLVDKSGRPQSVELKQSSGSELLDESALKTVRRWKFHPARMGMMKVESRVDIPIRFVLEEELKRHSR
ncbi:MAG TPA: energy transducer TonB [Verrucomicrobiae bacterium]|nr:energy transducer TonB [Verrucomicrobiae bacterium]